MLISEARTARRPAHVAFGPAPVGANRVPIYGFVREARPGSAGAGACPGTAAGSAARVKPGQAGRVATPGGANLRPVARSE